MHNSIIMKLRALRGPLLWSALVATLAFAALCANDYLERRRGADVIRALNDGEDRQIDPKSASSAVVLARITELLRRDRFDEAHALLDVFSGAGSSNASESDRALALYNIANYRVRRATSLISKGDFDGATALVNVAKGEYRLALRQMPEKWDFKHNLDVAMRMVRDLPQSESEPEEVPPDAPTRVWTDLPGVPKGLP